MSNSSNIEWTDATWNPVAGCSIVSPGCHHCYAQTMAKRLVAMGKEKYAGTVDANGRWTGKINFDDAALNVPLLWKKPRRVFVNSMSDLFHEGVPDSFINSVFRVMFEAKQHTFQILTKRAERMRKYTSDRWGKFGGKEYPLAENIWLGVSCEDQKSADERIPFLLQTPAAVRFLSCEPLLGPIDLSEWLYTLKVEHNGDGDTQEVPCRPDIHWIIVGGESGRGARPCNTEWIRDLVRQCQAASVACFVKQLGSKPMYERPAKEAGTTEVYVNGLKDKKGGDMSEWPEDLRVREFPATTAAASTPAMVTT